MFQVISRNNDPNGNPYRLIIEYIGVVVVGVSQARESSPNYVQELRREKQEELPSFHVSPKEYKNTIRLLTNETVKLRHV